MKEEGTTAALAYSALCASLAKPVCPPTHARGPRSRPSNTLPPARTAADEPDPLVSHHAPHAATSRQAPDDPTPLVSTVASSSPRPRILPRDRRLTSVAGTGPGSRKSHDLVPPCAAPTLPHASHRMRRTYHHRPIAVRH